MSLPDNDALLALSRYCGIADSYHDIWGNARPTSDDTRRALLKAMQQPLDEIDPEQILLTLEDERWQQPLPPVHVMRSGEICGIDICIADDDAAQTHRWVLDCESGERYSGEFTPASLPRLGERRSLFGPPPAYRPPRLASADFYKYRLEFPVPETIGYHSLNLELIDPDGDIPCGAAMPLILAPAQCFQPASITDTGRVWGATVQLNGVRSRRNWGIGDFTDLRNLVEMAADVGAGIVGVNPLHALFPDNPSHISPYSPSSRCGLNILYLDIEAMAEFQSCEAAQSMVASSRFQARLRSLRAEELVNHSAVAAAKMEILELLYQHFRSHHLATDSAHAQAFHLHRQNAGEALERLARFDALQAHFRATDGTIWGWPAWPEAFRDPHGPAVMDFVRTHAERIEFHVWLQWSAHLQLTEAGLQSWRRGLGIGIYGDLAVGVNPGGADTWGWQEVYANAAYAGAPPDDFNLQGQDWGLPPFIPHRLREVAYAPLIEALRATMRSAGALRIDHVMGLARLFWVPAGISAEHGAYVAYPLDELLGIVALESQRNQCLVIGEDLGTVPEGFRCRLASADFLSYHPLLFERCDDGSFKAPADYPTQALVCASTHDLPTLAGFWKGYDLDTRSSLQLYPSDAMRESMVIGRAQDRARLLMALEREQLLPEGASIHPVAVPELSQDFIAAIHTYLARTPARVLVIQPEDVLGIVEQANLPGSRDEQHPNWRRRLPLDLEDWRNDERIMRLAETLRFERGSAVTPHPEEASTPRRATIPRATYRLQFNREFTFAQATALVPYLAELGISHCYASPYLTARPGSGHGYDIVNHAALNPEIGSTEDFDAFVAALQAHGMNQILDVVPNHMGIMGADNAWWLDVLENGPAAEHGNYFDIDWVPLNPHLKGKILLPLLGDHYGAILNRGELKLEFDAERGEFSVFYYQHRLPIDPVSYPQIVGLRMERLAAALGEQGQQADSNTPDNRLVELESLLGGFARLPPRMEEDAARIAERQRDKEVHKRHLAALCAACPDIAHHVAENLVALNGRVGDPASFDLLHELIQAQGYRPAYWRVASDEINYRRFFDINELAALRMEDPAVFNATHQLVLDLVTQGKVDGLRIDHPDGLYDPGEYFGWLQERAKGKSQLQMQEKPSIDNDALPIYLVIEKILAEHERLPDDWPIHGATGYRFANLANALFVDSGEARRLTRIYEEFIGGPVDFDDLVYRAKKLIMDTALASELNVLANRLARIGALNRDTCDFTLNGLRDALAEIVASFPVYRSYVSSSGISVDDRRHIEWAVAVAKKHSPAADVSIFDFVQDVLTTDIAQGRSEAFHAKVVAFAMKFQQFSSPVMAKGVEDTTFYRYHRLTSLNDVGGEPRRFGISIAAYHAATRARAQKWPHNLLATSTHDSKRSEDVRARINVLSEMPAAWKLMLKRWSRLNRAKKRAIDDIPAPSANDEYLLYQTLLGSWPAQEAKDLSAADLETYRQRIEAYMIKAVREAKEHSSWVNVNVDYESALSDFIAGLLAPGEKNLFLADLAPVARRIAHHGLINSLGLTLLKLTSPGVPDIYQGCELWQFTLVDPDNRHPVDFEQRRQLLAAVKQIQGQSDAINALLEQPDDGRAKLFLIWQTLNLRRDGPELFCDGDYLPLTTTGEYAQHVCAYARVLGEQALIVVVPCLTIKLLGKNTGWPLGADVWGDTAVQLPENLMQASWTNTLTQGHLVAAQELQVSQILSQFPVALLSAIPHGEQ